MEYRSFGNTSLRVSAIGFGAWGIGGAAMAGSTPIGWGPSDDDTSRAALQKSLDLGINFFDTADFYGLGRSETLIGEVLGNRPDVVVATKVGHRLDNHGNIYLDYSKEHILEACEESLFRLRRSAIDFYQLHSARVNHFEEGACIEAMQQLQREGKIRYWGVSINTFAPEPEANWLMERNLGNGFQLVLNLLNQKAVPLLDHMAAKGYGVIARMPLQFGLLTGKFTPDTSFQPNDHRSFRLTPTVLAAALDALEPAWGIAEKYKTTKTGLALSFILGFPEVSTIIPGIKTPDQAISNTSNLVQLEPADQAFLKNLFTERFESLMPVLQQAG